jgi:hypothetical protein
MQKTNVMDEGKQICKILKEIRQRIAEENDIELITSECTYKGDCEGTCPKCEAELRYLEQELERRQGENEASPFSGIIGMDDVLSGDKPDSTYHLQGEIGGRSKSMGPLIKMVGLDIFNNPEDQ